MPLHLRRRRRRSRARHGALVLEAFGKGLCCAVGRDVAVLVCGRIASNGPGENGSVDFHKAVPQSFSFSFWPLSCLLLETTVCRAVFSFLIAMDSEAFLKGGEGGKQTGEGGMGARERGKWLYGVFPPSSSLSGGAEHSVCPHLCGWVTSIKQLRLSDG